MFTVITCQKNLQICLELVPGLLGQVQVQFPVIQNTFKSEPMSEIFCQKQAAAKLNVMTANLNSNLSHLSVMSEGPSWLGISFPAR